MKTHTIARARYTIDSPIAMIETPPPEKYERRISSESTIPTPNRAQLPNPLMIYTVFDTLPFSYNLPWIFNTFG